MDFYNSGKIKSYRCFSYDNHLGFVRKYDEKGQIIEDKGKIIISINIGPHDQKMFKGMVSFLPLIASNPPNTKTTVRCNILTPSGLNENYNMEQTVMDDFGVSIKFQESGMYKFEIEAEMYDSLTGIFKKENVKFEKEILAK